MTRILAPIAGGVLALCCAQAAAAQDWQYKATLYGWFPGLSSSIETPFGDVHADVGSSDVIAALDMAFMGSFAAQNGRTALVFDYLYADVSASEKTPFGKLFKEAKVDTRLSAFSGYLLYQLATDSPVAIDAGLGFRHFNLDIGTKLTPGLARGRSSNLSDAWTDGLIAARVRAPLNDLFYLHGFADAGMGTSDSSTWQVYAGFGYQIDPSWSVEAGWRYMDLSGEAEGKDVSLDLSGALVGLSYAF